MELKNSRELEVTRDKLRLLEGRYQALKAEDSGDSHVRELTLRSLKKLINQLTEEIVRYQIRHGVGAASQD